MNIKKLLSSFLIVTLLAGCNDNGDNPEESSEGIIVKSEVRLTSSSSQELYIKASTKPTATTDANWLHIGDITPSGTDVYTTTLTADENTLTEDRTTDLIISAGKSKTTVKVTQAAKDAIEITGVEPSATLEPNGGSIVLRFTSTSKPSVEAPEWMTYNKSFNYNKGEIKFDYGTAIDGDREGVIRLSLSPTVFAEITVTQMKGDMPDAMKSNAMQLAKRMYAGINIGNTMECPGQEGAWSKPVNETYVASLAKMGFNAVRIPCAFDSHLKNNGESEDGALNTEIDPAWLDRVNEVIGYVLDNGMYAILNIHWDGGWLENSCKEGYSEEVNTKQHDYWTQIANRLNHYDEHLLFAAMNEPNVAEGSDAKKRKSIEAIMKYQQTMLDAVRATGGNNAYRVLVMQAPNTSNEIAVEGVYGLPKDVVADRLMIETHFYGPYQFNMMENDADWGKTFWYWGKENHVEGSDRNTTWGEEDWVKEQFDLIKRHYIDKGIPGITGEYCVCCNREKTKGIDKEKWRASARLWAKVVTMESKKAGMVPFFWETGGDIDRNNGDLKNPLQIEGVLEGAAETDYPF